VIAQTVLRSEPGAYRFTLDTARVDVWRFDDLAARAAAVDAAEAVPIREEALALVQGDVLDTGPPPLAALGQRP
jgi:hypothetical protein